MMPLILICGIPGSGKTTRAKKIKEFLEVEHNCKVIHINEENLELNKQEAYKDFQAEKFTRGYLKSNVEKNLTNQAVIILDSLNYIKGYRYEMFCLARSNKTQHCVIYCEADIKIAREYNQQNQNNFTEDMLVDYSSRMEIPNQKNRWDSPLFHLRINEQTPCQEIANVLLFQTKKSKDPVSTAPVIKIIQKKKKIIQGNIVRCQFFIRD
ncbi:KTI12 chromatin associated, putative [Ichthyophthirius multifiliis]|uniref:KTI12 chromatin associated, putative n=1 Tax=Ichthyophthirius multifiliis TaxID=5932 RepID=G0QN31_ICHMU|nr:KTI12 chromatin associated, putative [Ichthyophthirius multifiliis]EGR33360.1 KTI12 chromatin associated, putative [Ichthyophthirius multifiliis]|eukprot:XP_004037346.1 KTI12 chromatin associated, putative [Ichthyophthirius multifiliis]